MPVRVLEVAGGTGLVFHCHGRVEGQDHIRANREVMADPGKLGTRYFCIIDHSGATEMSYDGSAVKHLVEQDKQLMKHLRPGFLVAVVAPGNLEFGFSRMWQSMAEVTGWEILVVRSRDEAERWVRLAAQRKFHVEIPGFAPELNGPAERKAE